MQHTFSGRLEQMETGFPMRQVIFIPGDIAEALGLKANLRLIGSLNGAPFRLAALSNGAGQFYLSVSRDLKKAAGAQMGSLVKVDLAIDPNPDALDMPEEWLEVIAQEPEVGKIFNELTVGYRRSILHYLNGAKRSDTRIKRSLELAEKLRNRTLNIWK
ncbi:MAG: YdeI/OmpD-associated family protein [Chitinophagales bacterium]|nr:YdeI/OmpD-associated family protein [Chitinophagales bacterium]